MTRTNGSDRETSTPVAFRRVQYEHVGRTRVLTVFCPRRNQVMDVGECRKCEHCRGLCIDPADRDAFVRCGWQHERAAPRAAGSAHAALSAIMSAPVYCVAPEDSLESVRLLLSAHAIGAAPVVDANGRAIGVVSKGDVMRGLDRESAPPDATEPVAPCVRQVMSHVVFALHAEADISRAAALMAYEGVHHVVVTGASGQPAGIVSSLDVLRWFARESGYVMPGAE
jgi:CBS domain-containing protein